MMSIVNSGHSTFVPALTRRRHAFHLIAIVSKHLPYKRAIQELPVMTAYALYQKESSCHFQYNHSLVFGLHRHPDWP